MECQDYAEVGYADGHGDDNAVQGLSTRAVCEGRRLEYMYVPCRFLLVCVRLEAYA